MLLKFINGKSLIWFLKNKYTIFPKSRLGIQTSSKIIKNLKYFSIKKKYLSSCLSKAITVKFLLDLVNINNKIIFGISKTSYGKKIPHAWIVDPINGDFLTPGLNNKKGLKIYEF